MICQTRPRKNAAQPSNAPFGVPSPARIRHLAAKIQMNWSPRTRARRAAVGAKRVELMLVSAVAFGDSPELRDD